MRRKHNAIMGEITGACSTGCISAFFMFQLHDSMYSQALAFSSGMAVIE